MKGFGAGLIMGGIIVFLVLVVIGLSMNNQDNVTGEAIKTSSPAQQTDQVNEQVIIDTQETIKENMVYFQTFEVLNFLELYVNITSDEFFNYALLPDNELDHYLKGESYKSFKSLEGLLFIQDKHNLDVGKYSIIITSLDKPINFNLIVKGTEL